MTLNEFLECTRWMSEYEYDQFIEDCDNGGEQYYLDKLEEKKARQTNIECFEV